MAQTFDMISENVMPPATALKITGKVVNAIIKQLKVRTKHRPPGGPAHVSRCRHAQISTRRPPRPPLSPSNCSCQNERSVGGSWTKLFKKYDYDGSGNIQVQPSTPPALCLAAPPLFSLPVRLPAAPPVRSYCPPSLPPPPLHSLTASHRALVHPPASPFSSMNS